MDAAALTSKLDAIASGLVTEKARFGQSDALAAWVEPRHLVKVAKAVRDDETLRLDWLENLSVAQAPEGALVFTYFLRSRASAARLILRASVKPPGADREAEIPSVDEIWPMAWTMEAEAAELFGVNFKDRRTEAEVGFASSGPRGWSGFPLRKTFAFPTEGNA